MNYCIGRKLCMTSFFDEATGEQSPCTVIEAGPCVITQIKTRDKDGYSSVQLAYGEKKEKRTSKSLLNHFKKSSTSPKRVVKEFSGENADKVKLGDVFNSEIFEEGEFVNVSAITKGKGFQGVVKRHGFSGVGEATHGQHDRDRAPGSIGASSDPSRVFKGMKMAGRMGGKMVTVKNLRVIKVLKEKNCLLVKGCIPGHNKSVVYLKKTS